MREHLMSWRGLIYMSKFAVMLDGSSGRMVPCLTIAIPEQKRVAIGGGKDDSRFEGGMGQLVLPRALARIS
jgi:hypothetical protein